jgi:hypothetical protein
VNSHRFAAGLALAASAIPAQTWTEAGEAGSLPGSAQVPQGSGALTRIDGAIDDPALANPGADSDMFLIAIDDPKTFAATTVGGTSLDTQLFLFDHAGFGVSFDDDDPLGIGRLQSRLSGAFVAAPGLYWLAVSRYDLDATGGGAPIWNDAPFVAERPPDGPGAGNAVDGWSGVVPTAATGGYSIFLTGASFPGSSCSDLAVAGSGAPGTRLVFALTGAEPRALALLAIGAREGAFTLAFGPLGTLELGLDPPFATLPMGITDGNGDADLRVRVPSGLPGMDLFAQGFSARLSFAPASPPVRLSFCASGVEPFRAGG